MKTPTCVPVTTPLILTVPSASLGDRQTASTDRDIVKGLLPGCAQVEELAAGAKAHRDSGGCPDHAVADHIVAHTTSGVIVKNAAKLTMLPVVEANMPSRR